MDPTQYIAPSCMQWMQYVVDAVNTVDTVDATDAVNVGTWWWGKYH